MRCDEFGRLPSRPVPGRSAGRTMGLAVLMALLPALTAATAHAEDRSVTIIEGAPEPPAELAPPAEAAPPLPAPTPDQADAPLTLLNTANPAGVKIDILPGPALAVGTDVVFKVTTQRPGYLVLVDINAEKTASQIYPNIMSLAKNSAQRGVTNLLKPGASVSIPDLKNPFARFTFRTEPPLGRGIIVAILSEQPVQLIDLPELTTDAGPQAAIDSLDQGLRKLLVADTGHAGQFHQGTWSLAAVEYLVK